MKRKTGSPSFYATDLAYVHDVAFGDYARRVAPEVVRLLATSRIRRGLIVELGSGTGITAEHLVQHGFDVHGIDISRAMVRRAKSRVHGATFRTASIWSARVPRCIAVISIGEVITYATGERHGVRQLELLFRRVHDALEPGGLFLFDFMESAKGRTYSGRSRAGEDWALTVSASVNPAGRWLTRRITTFRRVNGTFRRASEVHRVRLFDRKDVGRALASAGFDVRFQRALGRVRMMKGDVLGIARKKRSSSI